MKDFNPLTMKNIKYLGLALLSGLLLTITSCKKDNIDTPTPETEEVVYSSNTMWTIYEGSSTELLYLPDANVTYSVADFIKPTNNTRIRITGTFPQSRYMSFNFYNPSEGEPLISVVDVDIIPDSESVNPFLPNHDVNNSSKKYTINFVPEGSDTTGLLNPHYYPNNYDTLSIFNRLYAPEVSSIGGVELPTIEMFNMDVVNAIALPDFGISKELSVVDTTRLFGAYQLAIDDTVRAYRFASANLFENKDAKYLLMPLKLEKATHVTVIKFKAPTIPLTYAQNGSTDLRYFSLNQGDHLTYNYDGLYDKEFNPPLGDGFIYVVISDGSSAVAAKINALGATAMNWKVPGSKMFLLYRTILPQSNFVGDLVNVPVFDENNTSGSMSNNHSKLHIGDYGVTGLKVSKADFLAASDLTTLVPF